jgi:hypothetical protein
VRRRPHTVRTNYAKTHVSTEEAPRYARAWFFEADVIAGRPSDFEAPPLERPRQNQLLVKQVNKLASSFA